MDVVLVVAGRIEIDDQVELIHLCTRKIHGLHLNQFKALGLGSKVEGLGFMVLGFRVFGAWGKLGNRGLPRETN